MTQQRLDPKELKGFPTSSRRLIALARLMGWDTSWTNVHRDAVLMRSTTGKEVKIPQTSLNANRAKSTFAQVLTHTTNAEIVNLLSGNGIDLLHDDDAAEMLGTMITPVLDWAESHRPELLEVYRNLPGSQDRYPDMARQERGRAVVLKVITEEAAPTKTPIEVIIESAIEAPVDAQPTSMREAFDVATKVVEPTTSATDTLTCPECGQQFQKPSGMGAHRAKVHGVKGTSKSVEAWRNKRAADAAFVAPEQVTRVPLLAKAGKAYNEAGGRVFVSSAIDEITYADGSKGYGCRKCDYTAPAMVSVRGHTQSHGKDYEGDKRPIRELIKVDEYVLGPPHPRSSPSLRKLLLAALAEIENWPHLSTEELAIRLENFVTAHRPEPVPTEPLTDTEILAKISTLVERGRYDTLTTSLTEVTDKVVVLTETTSRLEQERNEAQAEVERVRGNMQALREMLNEEDS